MIICFAKSIRADALEAAAVISAENDHERALGYFVLASVCASSPEGSEVPESGSHPWNQAFEKFEANQEQNWRTEAAARQSPSSAGHEKEVDAPCIPHASLCFESLKRQF